jgi:hypothetical protein
VSREKDNKTSQVASANVETAKNAAKEVVLTL